MTTPQMQPLAPPHVFTCPLCGCADCPTRYRLKDYGISRCVRCHFDFNAHFGGGGCDGETFDRDYFLDEHQAAFESQMHEFRRDPSVPVFESRLDQVESLIPQGRLLDVGPGFGTFLRIAQDRGWMVEGVELSEFAASHIRDQHGIDIFTGDLGQYEGEDGQFDLITFWDSIEHMAAPRENLERAFRLLRPGGILLLATDNFHCLIAVVSIAAYRMSFGRLTYPMRRLYIDRNLAYFTEKTFRRLVTQIGFRELAFETMEYPLSKIRVNSLERLALRAMYTLAAMTNTQAQMTLIARKP